MLEKIQEENKIDVLIGERFVTKIPVTMKHIGEDGFLVASNYRLFLLSTSFKIVEQAPAMTFFKVELQQDSIEMNSRDSKRWLLKSRELELPEKVMKEIRNLTFPIHILNLFAFQHGFALRENIKFKDLTPWNFLKIERDYERMGLTNDKSWSISDANRNFHLCESYPEKWVVPRIIQELALKKISRFRTKGRIPVVTWKNRNGPQTLLRSSQPGIGIMNGRCIEDEVLMREVKATNPQADKLYIFDARNYAAAMANRAAGGGFENTNEPSYGSCEIIFLGIENMHTIRDSFESLARVCSNNMDESRWFTLLDSTKWHHHLMSLLSGANHITKKLIVEKASCLVHCTDGWDRTSALVSLVQVMVDPYYRTFEGLQVLIEKDWLHFGHPFSFRSGQPSSTTTSPGCSSINSQAPIFFQFLSCLYQILKQESLAFEFNQKLLLFLSEHVYSCRFGDFLGNSEFERKKLQIRTHTASIWTYLAINKQEYINPAYTKKEQVIYPMCSVTSINFWGEYFFPSKPEKGDTSVAEALNSVAVQKQKVVESFQKRVEENRKRRSISVALSALRANMYERKMIHQESHMISSLIISELVHSITNSPILKEPWTQLSESLEDGSQVLSSNASSVFSDPDLEYEFVN